MRWRRRLHGGCWRIDGLWYPILVSVVKLDGLTLLPHQPGMKDAKDYDLASTQGFEMPLEILVLDKSEEIVCHSSSCCLTQSHMVCICFVAVIVPS